MSKQQKLKIALPVLIVGVALVWGPIFFGSDSKNKKSKGGVETGNASLESSGPADSEHIAALPQFSQQERAKTSYADWGRNPFALGQKQDVLMVEGILWDAQNPKVMINGNILGVGEKLGSITVIDIKPSSVILKGKKGEVELSSGGVM